MTSGDRPADDRLGMAMNAQGWPWRMTGGWRKRDDQKGWQLADDCNGWLPVDDCWGWQQRDDTWDDWVTKREQQKGMTLGGWHLADDTKDDIADDCWGMTGGWRLEDDTPMTARGWPARCDKKEISREKFGGAARKVEISLKSAQREKKFRA